MSVVTGTADDVVTVPASAVADGVVTVVEDGVATPTAVTVGVTGSSRVEVTEGLAKGDEVVLADLAEAVPTGDTGTTLRFGQGGPGGTVEFRMPAGGGGPRPQ